MKTLKETTRKGQGLFRTSKHKSAHGCMRTKIMSVRHTVATTIRWHQDPVTTLLKNNLSLNHVPTNSVLQVILQSLVGQRRSNQRYSNYTNHLWSPHALPPLSLDFENAIRIRVLTVKPAAHKLIIFFINILLSNLFMAQINSN